MTDRFDTTEANGKVEEETEEKEDLSLDKLRTMIDEDRNNRVKMFNQELEVLKRKYKCNICIHQIYRNGQPSGPLQLEIIPD